MTDGMDKRSHPQVQLLLALLRPGGRYVELGCGGGQVCALVGETAEVQGFDIAPLAIAEATARHAGPRVRFAVAPAAACPLPAGVADGAYCFEVLEHLWDPHAALRELVRLVKPGGFVLFSCPNRFSLDLHLRKRPAVRAAEVLLAAARLVRDRLAGTVYVNLVPDLAAPTVYPDCDMCASLVPVNLPRTLRRLGAEPVFLDLYYMRAHDPRDGVRELRLQRRAGQPFVRWCGDHILCLARKR
jgi:SAM-dependent methyltransferase